MKIWVTQLRKGLVEYCVLKVLAAGESHGYRIMKRLRTMDSLAVTECTVYPILTRLRNEGFLRVRTEDSPTGPPRRNYALTALGRHRLRDMDAHWDALCDAIHGLDAQEGSERKRARRQGRPGGTGLGKVGAQQRGVSPSVRAEGRENIKTRIRTGAC